MGKTTALFQIAEALLNRSNASPIIVSLGDWSTEDVTLLESILKRHLGANDSRFRPSTGVEFRSSVVRTDLRFVREI